MDFEYTDVITIEEYSLEEMYSRVKKGEEFLEVYEDIMCGADDCDFYNRFKIINEVRDEINKRLKQSGNYDKLIK